MNKVCESNNGRQRSEFWYVYLLISKKNSSWYTGCTNDLKERFKEHNSGKSKYTKDFMPWELIYYEAGMNKKDAYRRERYLKSGSGRKWLKNRLRFQEIDSERRRPE